MALNGLCPNIIFHCRPRNVQARISLDGSMFAGRDWPPPVRLPQWCPVKCTQCDVIVEVNEWFCVFVTFGITYPSNSVSSKALCGKPDGTRVSNRIISRTVASVYERLRTDRLALSENTFILPTQNGNPYLIRSSNVGKRPLPTTLSISFCILHWISGCTQICWIKKVTVADNADSGGNEKSKQVNISWSSAKKSLKFDYQELWLIFL